MQEHFNSPVVLGIRNGTFARHGLKVEWKVRDTVGNELTAQEIPEGTGRMCNMLRDGSLDIALILTEGIVRGMELRLSALMLADIVQGSHAKIVATYIETPLTWAACVRYCRVSIVTERTGFTLNQGHNQVNR